MARPGSLTIPPDVSLPGWQLVLYAQKDASAKITGAIIKGM